MERPSNEVEVIGEMHGNFKRLEAMTQLTINALNTLVDLCIYNEDDSLQLTRFKRDMLIVVRKELGKLCD